MYSFFEIFIYGYFILAALGLYIIARDRRHPARWFGCYKKLSAVLAGLLILGAIIIFDAHFIEPWTITVTYQPIPSPKITAPLKIAFVSDLQAGNHKKSAWVEKIAERVEQEKPDLVLLGGDQIDNEGTFEDESLYLEPLRALAEKYLTYAILGNHEYGIGSAVVGEERYYTGNRSQLVDDRLKKLGIKLLRADWDCPEIRGQKICLFGLDDIWGAPADFAPPITCHPELVSGSVSGYANGKMLNQSQIPVREDIVQHDNCVPNNTFTILLTHNPDGILSWPKNWRAPDLVLAGHTHGGQIRLPFLGPLGDAGIALPKIYYRGLNFFNHIPIFTSVGAGESGGALRLFNLPEIAVINLIP